MIKQKLSKEIFILDAVRTISCIPGKALKDYTAAQMGSAIIQALLRRTGVDKNNISQVILGNVVSAGTGQNVARQAALFASLPYSVDAFAVNYVCGSGLQAAFLASQEILNGTGEIIIAGGTESVSDAPFLLNRAAFLAKEKPEAIDSLKQDGLFCEITGKRMGELVEGLAAKYQISRPEQDDYALESHQKACAAQERGFFDGEIIAVDSTKPSERKDERPRKSLDLDVLTEFPAVFKKDGTVTAGNSSVPCDGAAGVLLAGKDAIRRHKIKPLARIIGFAAAMIDPKQTFEAASVAAKECLSVCGLAVKNIDLFEIGEAFAAQAIFNRRDLNIPKEKFNVLGGDVALGHPLGAAGARLLVTLSHTLRNRKLKKGLACVPFGGGGAIAVIIEAK